MSPERKTVLLVLSCSALALVPARAFATADMQVQAKRLGLAVRNCLHCHATAHAVEKMKDKAKALAMSDGNCLACHAANIPAKLNDRGRWLVGEKRRRGARECDMAWLRDYKEPDSSTAVGEPDAPAQQGRSAHAARRAKP